MSEPKVVTIPDKYIPTVELRMFVETLLSPEVRGNKEEAERRCGVSRQKFYYHFQRHPEFREWYSQRCEDFLKNLEALAASKLISKVQAGELEAIKLYYELTGKIKNKGVDVKVGVNVTNRVGSNGKFTGEDRDLQERIRRDLFPSLS